MSRYRDASSLLRASPLVLALSACSASALEQPHPDHDAAEPETPACTLTAVREVAEIEAYCAGPPSLAIDGEGRLHAGWATSLPYTGHGASRAADGAWIAKIGHYGEARGVHLTGASSGVHALVESELGPTLLRPAGAEPVELLWADARMRRAMRPSTKRSIAAGNDGALHMLLVETVEEECTVASEDPTCASSRYRYEHFVTRASGSPDSLVFERLAETSPNAGALGVAASSFGAAFLVNPGGRVELHRVSDGELDTSAAEDLMPAFDDPDEQALPDSVALSAEGDAFVLARLEPGYRVIHVSSDGEIEQALELRGGHALPTCPTSPEVGTRCEQDITRYSTAVLSASDEASFVLVRKERSRGAARYRCDLPVDTPSGFACGYDLDVPPERSLHIALLDGASSHGFDLPAEELGVPQYLDAVAVGARIHLLALEGVSGPPPCRLREVEIDCSGLLK